MNGAWRDGLMAARVAGYRGFGTTPRRQEKPNDRPLAPWRRLPGCASLYRAGYGRKYV